ncbi:hypothetical protein RJ640_018930 [Escallonia rubra]|uniref:Uncharacterized protein n=1 Tax=Escallonia rubra TaxID=112253 RepID=A0AA88RC64_9ASTE|nr:hypothetical protein RJ640_018930 [Escallonia rubra]
MASAKLIYVKYLNELDQWLRTVFRDKGLGNGEIDVIGKLDLLLRELEGSRYSVRGGQDRKKIDGDLVRLESSNNGNGRFIDRDTCKGDYKELHKIAKGSSSGDDEKYCLQDDNSTALSAKSIVEKVINGYIDRVHTNAERSRNENGLLCVQYDKNIVLSANSVVEKVISGNIYKLHKSAERNTSDDDEKYSAQDDNNIVLSAKSVVEKVMSSRKRKRQLLSLPKMLNWLIQVAKRSNDPALGKGPECSKWKEYGSEELWQQALFAREALLRRKYVEPDSDESPLQKKRRMHPSMYEDDDILHHQSTERLRCSNRLPLTKSQLCSCCNSRSTSPRKLASPRKAKPDISPKEPAPVTDEILTTNVADDMPEDVLLQKQVSVGPLFQAEVPAWTGVISESDTKWVGIRTWPPEGGRVKPLISMDPIGKGRQTSCQCQLPGSTGCVRFHIAEKRIKLKLELGSAFFHWKFQQMGEEVSLSWKMDEEKRFKHMVKLDATSINKFWKNAFKLFPTKTRDKLVSYYFNVLLLRRRSYQNRVTPENIDSDDEETEFGSVGETFGYEAIHVRASELPMCSQNAQCTDVD